MFYYCDSQTRRCCLTSTAPLVAGLYVEVVCDPVEGDYRALRYETRDGKNVIVFDEEYMATLIFDETKERQLELANRMVSHYEDISSFGPVETKEQADEEVMVWRQFRYNLNSTTYGELPNAPTVKEFIDG